MNEAFVEDAEDDVDRDHRGEKEQGLAGERGLERLRRALVGGLDADGQIEVLAGLVDGGDGVAHGGAGREVEGERDDGKLALMRDGQRPGLGLPAREGAEGGEAGAGGYR